MSPEMRFTNHKRGYKSNRYAKKFGLKLRPDLFACYNPMPYEAAAELEIELAAGQARGILRCAQDDRGF